MERSHTLLRTSAGVFAVGYLVAMLLPTLPEGAYSDDRVAALLHDASDRTAIIAGSYGLVIAALAFLVFVGLLAHSLEVEGQMLTRTLQLAGTAYAAMLLVAAVAFGSVPLGVAIGELPDGLEVDVFRVLSNAGFYALLVPALLAAAVVLVCTSVLLRRTDGVPTWCAVMGFALAPLLLMGFAWVPQFLVPLWALTLAYALPRRLPDHASVPVAA